MRWRQSVDLPPSCRAVHDTPTYGPRTCNRGRLQLSDDAALHCAVVTFVVRARCRKRSAVETGVSHPVQPKKLPVEVLIRCARALDLERPQEQLTVRTIPQGMRFYHSHSRIVPE